MRAIAAILTLLFALGPGTPSAGEEGPSPAPSPAATIAVSFKLDPRLSGPTYGGERWVSPPTYTGAAAQEVVEARASAIDSQGRPTRARLEWSPSDPEMVAVSPPRGEQVKIAVKRAGESAVTVRSGGAVRKLVVRTVDRNGLRQLTISQ